MKNEIKPDMAQEKARFFAQYYGQAVYRLDGLYKLKCEPFGTHMEGDHLELIPLSDITDYDLAVLADDFDISIGNGFSNMYDDLKDFKDNLDTNSCWPVGFFDYLRSKGYALPWMKYSVEQQIAMGWIKLKGDSNHG